MSSSWLPKKRPCAIARYHLVLISPFASPLCKVHIRVARTNRHLVTTLGRLGLSGLLPHATHIPRPRLL